MWDIERREEQIRGVDERPIGDALLTKNTTSRANHGTDWYNELIKTNDGKDDTM